MGFASITPEERRQTHEALLAFSPAVPLVADLACDALGGTWLKTVNLQRRGATPPKTEIRALDERSALAVLAYTPQIADTIGPDWADRARRLNAIFNAAMHANEMQRWRAGDAQRAVQLSGEIRSFLESRAIAPAAAPAYECGTAQALLGLMLPPFDRVLAVAFSSDGSRIATGSQTGAACVWDHADGNLLLALKRGGEPVTDIAFSPDGTRIMGAEPYREVRIWDGTSGKERRSLRCGPRLRSMALSPDGTQFATTGGDNDAWLWDSDRGTQLAAFKHHSQVWDAAFSGDGRLLATACGGRAHLWHIPPETRETALQTRGLRAWAQRKTRDQSSYQGSQEERATDCPLRTLIGHSGDIQGVALSFDGALVGTASEDGTARVWDSADGRELVRVTHDAEVQAVMFSPAGTVFATASWDETARLWDVSSGEELARLRHGASVNDVAFSPDGTLIATGDNDGTAWIWDSVSVRGG